jgi:PHD/YefM family antitoxin component YafN of YafNO toxin-antitoxin module
MTVFTFSEARQNFASVLEKAKTEGKVLIRRKDGTVFILQPMVKKNSPLNVAGVDVGLSQDEIIEILKEVRER